MIRLTLAMTVICFSSQTFAQSADETAAYVITGTTLGQRPLSSFSSEFVHRGRQLKASISKRGECKYSLVFTHENQVVQERVYDFNRAGSAQIASLYDLYTTLEIKGEGDLYCLRSDEVGDPTAFRCWPETSMNHKVFGSWDPKRTLLAFDYLKANYCKGMAF